jgi:hypothetical protein
VNPEEEERLRRIREQEEEEERRRQAEWETLDEETRFFRTAEDRFKSPSIRWEAAASFSFQLQERELVVFEERVNFDGGEWIFLAKQPCISEEELAKLRKSKPKTLNLNDLFPVVFRGWVDLTSFRKEGCATLQ